MTIQDLQSPETDQISLAFALAKSNFKPTWADSQSNYKKDGFVGLDAIEESTRDALHEQGITVRQGRCKKDGEMFLFTILAHKSGQWFASYSPIAPIDISNKRLVVDQQWGTSMSYQRRYELYGMLGLGKGDPQLDVDDKNYIGKEDTDDHSQDKKAPQQQEKKPFDPSKLDPSKPASNNQKKTIVDIVGSNVLIAGLMRDKWKIESVNDLNLKTASEVITWLKAEHP